MNKQTTIISIFKESKMSKEDCDLYSNFLESKLSAVGSETNTPWFVKIITIVGAWFASLLFLGFFIIAKLLKSEESMIISGSIFIATGLLMSHANKKNHIIDSFSLSLSLLGQILLGAGIGHKTNGLNSVCYTGIAVESLIYLLSSSYTQKFISVILLPVCFLGLFWNSQFFEFTNFLIGGLSLATVLVWINELQLQIRLKKYPLFYIPTAYGLVLALLLILVLSINNKFFKVNISHWYIASFISFFSLSFLLYKFLCKGLSISLKIYWLTVLAIAVIFSPTVNSPGIITSALIIVLGFERSNKALLTLGFLFLATFVITFYYSLQQTLLIKSIILMSTGILLLGMHFAFSVALKREK